MYHFKIVFGFGHSLYQIWHSLKNCGNFTLQNFKVVEENLELVVLFLLLPRAASVSEDLIAEPSEKIRMMTNPCTILSLDPKGMHTIL